MALAVVMALCCVPASVAANDVPGSWKVAPADTRYRLNGIAMIAANDIWAVGVERLTTRGSRDRPYAQHWDGAQWTAVPIPAPSASLLSIRGVAGSASNDVWAVGDYEVGTNDLVTHTLIDHWDGNQWSTIPSADPPGTRKVYTLHLTAVTATSPSDAWAVGSYEYLGKPPAEPYYIRIPLVEHWDGHSWSIMSLPPLNLLDDTDDTLTAIMALSSTDVWVVGQQPASYVGSPYPRSYMRPLAAHWNGTQWSLVDVPSAENVSTTLVSVSATGPNDVWAVGYSENDFLFPSGTIVVHWDGNAWATQTTPDLHASVSELSTVAALTPSDIWVAGDIGKIVGSGGDVATFDTDVVFLHWDGNAWAVIPTPTPNDPDPSFDDAHADYPRQFAAVSPSELWLIGTFGTAKTNLLHYTVP
jgi:hypothetical protein